VYVRDLRARHTRLVSVTPTGAPGDGTATDTGLSADGRSVVFSSDATDLVAGDTNGEFDVFVRDLRSGVTRRVSLTAAGGQAGLGGSGAVISGDGRTVAFGSVSTDLTADPASPDPRVEVYVRDLRAGTTVKAATGIGGAAPDGVSGSGFPSLSGDGHRLAFRSDASNLAPGPDTNDGYDVFVRDLRSGAVVRVSTPRRGEPRGAGGAHFGRLSAGGCAVTLDSFATDLAPGDTHGVEQVYLRRL
jgi:Tol biopolymer transport system component